MQILDYRQVFVIRIRNKQGAVFRTLATVSAKFLVDETGLLYQMNFELARFSFDFFDLSQGNDFDVGMSGRLNESGGQDSDGTVIGGEGLVQRGHGTADR